MENRWLKMKSLNPPEEIKNVAFWRLALIFYFVYSVLGMFIGVTSIIMGFVLLINGIVSKSSIIDLEVLGFKANLQDFPAGIGFLIGGVMIFFITRYSVKSAKSNNK